MSSFALDDAVCCTCSKVRDDKSKTAVPPPPMNTSFDWKMRDSSSVRHAKFISIISTAKYKDYHDRINDIMDSMCNDGRVTKKYPTFEACDAYLDFNFSHLNN